MSEKRNETSLASKKATNPSVPSKSNALQTNLFAFFASSVPVPPKKRKLTATGTGIGIGIGTGATESCQAAMADDSKPLAATATATMSSSTAPAMESNHDPIIPTQVPTPRNAQWHSVHDDSVLIRRPLHEPSRSKVAALDLDGTLFRWTSPSWPNALEHYELWNTGVISKLQELYDHAGYKLLIVSNQGAIQKAHHGKKATLVQSIIHWLAHTVDRPIHAVLSTRSTKVMGEDASFHKPSSKMWGVATRYLNQQEPLTVADSFFVGDSADPHDPQGGVDAKFAANVGTEFGSDGDDSTTALRFYTPDEFFGPSHADRRKQERTFANHTPSPATAQQTRAALLGGYLKTKTTPILLLLCGVQGSGKSTFCERLLLLEEGTPDVVAVAVAASAAGKNNHTAPNTTHWTHLSQDTIRNGRPGTREMVEREARAALEEGRSVLVDRMHLDPIQRSHFLQLAASVGVPTHVIVFTPPILVVTQRVHDRTNHPGKVQGPKGVRQALQSLEQLQVPTYAESGVALISNASTTATVDRLVSLYCGIGGNGLSVREPHMSVPLPSSKSSEKGSVELPMIVLGSMKIGKKIAHQTIQSAAANGIQGLDTAPSYKNIDALGSALVENLEVKCIIAKVPLGVTQPHQVREELQRTLTELQRSSVDVLLLHWPHVVIQEKSMASVWKAMEDCCQEGLCQALGVCNFNATALTQLLSTCSMPPTINQVERHPLCAQLDLVDFCAQQDIVVQAHTPLGQGNDELLGHAQIQAVAKETSQSPAQVVLRWNLQQGIPVVPKCRSEAHMTELTSTKALSSDHMKRLDELDKGRRFVSPPWMYGSASYCWDERIPPNSK